MQISLFCLIVWILAWGLRACLLDTEPARTDNLLGYANAYYRALANADLRGFIEVILTGDYSPPLAVLVATLLAAPMGFSLEAVRISCLLLHPVVVVQVYFLSRAIRPDRDVALMAALLTGTVPMIFGWFRSDFPEPLVTVLVLATLHSMLVTDLRRPWPAVRLGLLTGLGILSKLAFPIFIVFPAAYLAATRIRDTRTLACAGLSLLAALAVCGWWLVQSFGSILVNFGLSTASTQEGGHVLDRVVKYLWLPSGNLSLTAVACVGVWLALRDRSVDRHRLNLVLVSWAGAYLMFLLLFDTWARYILPLLPLSCVLAAQPWGWLMRRLSGQRRRLALVAASLSLLSVFVVLNFTSSRETRDHLGLISPILSPDRAIFETVRGRLLGGNAAVVISSTSERVQNQMIRHMARHDRPLVVSACRGRNIVEQGGAIYRVHVTPLAEEANHANWDGGPGHAALKWMERRSVQMDTYRDARLEIRLVEVIEVHRR